MARRGGYCYDGKEVSCSCGSSVDPSWSKYSVDNDIFFGVDDMGDSRDFMYKEDVIEFYRREEPTKSLRSIQRERSSIADCFEFFKFICCIRS
ncbi:hypothetical protein Patl1_19869 [Pistacia atlantica]|uniref:Uncharacterized protein n=1 Tax=Pistacia atlantica TaxID=434234 RepID=A0ACC1BID3_9ROSI|nr:hypothetical protein Patl1_19869 [Pistacia atlantica]